MMKKLFVIGLFSASSAFAAGVCEPEMARYCLGVLQLGHQELNSCLADHKELLSPACRNSLPKNLVGTGKYKVQAKTPDPHGEGHGGDAGEEKPAPESHH